MQGWGTGREKPGRQEAHFWDSAPNQQCHRAVSPTIHTLRGPSTLQIHFPLNVLLSKVLRSLKPKNQMEPDKDRSLDVCVGTTGHLGPEGLAGNADHGTREP